MNNSASIKDILLNENITTWFQAVLEPHSNKVLGWEGLTRGPSISALHSAPALFAAAQEAKLLKPLELMCIRNAIKSFEQLQLGGKLFVNISHELFLAGNHLRKQFKELMLKGPLESNKIVLELTEQRSTTDLDKLIEACDFFHQMGFQIAIDDLGIGEISHEQWMKLKPDYVKIARQYVNDIDKDKQKQTLVKSIVMAARSSQTKVIALGIETKEELSTLRKLGVTISQGYLFQRPQLAPTIPDLSEFQFPELSSSILACDLVNSHERISSEMKVDAIMARFNHLQSIEALAIEREGKVIGLIKRPTLEKAIASGSLRTTSILGANSKLIERNFISIDAYTPISELTKTLISRSRHRVYDDFVITSQDSFLGTASVIDVLRLLAMQVNSQPSPEEIAFL